MTMGQYIKHLRENAGLSQEELRKSLNPPVNRAAVQKWETDKVENIKRTHIQQLARKFGVSPCELMCFDDRFDSAKAAEETKTLELVQKNFGKEAVKVLQMFCKMNQSGQQKVLEDMSDMTELSKYIQKRFFYIEKRIDNVLYVNFNKSSTQVQDDSRCFQDILNRSNP